MATTMRSSTDTLTDQERDALRAGCEHRLQGHGVRNIPAMLAELSALPADELEADVYGAGGTVAVLEQEVCELLGKPASVFMPSGTMAQQIALRRTTEAVVTAGIRRLAGERSLWAFGGGAPLDTPSLRGLELTVGDATLAFTPDEVADIVRELLPSGADR